MSKRPPTCCRPPWRSRWRAGWLDVDLVLDGQSDDCGRVQPVAARRGTLTRQLPGRLDLDALPVHRDGYQRVCLVRGARSCVSIYAMSWLAATHNELD